MTAGAASSSGRPLAGRALHTGPDGYWGAPRRSSPNLKVVELASPRRLSRLAEELEESGLPRSDGAGRDVLLEEIDKALRPRVHEGRIPTTGTVIGPRSEPVSWAAQTGLNITKMRTGPVPQGSLRRFVDGLSSWLCRSLDGTPDQVLLFDRPAGSERDLVILAKAFGATVVQRHPSGMVRAVGDFGVLRWEGLQWHLEHHVQALLDTVGPDIVASSPVLEPLLVFAVHDLAPAGIGALLIAREDATPGPGFQDRLSVPPELHIGTPTHLAPLRHALAHVDGAAIFDQAGVLRRLGVVLAPSVASRLTVPLLGGTRHTSAARYSYDDPSAVVIVVSEDGPVTLLRAGRVLAHSRSYAVRANENW